MSRIFFGVICLVGGRGKLPRPLWSTHAQIIQSKIHSFYWTRTQLWNIHFLPYDFFLKLWFYIKLHSVSFLLVSENVPIYTFVNMYVCVCVCLCVCVDRVKDRQRDVIEKNHLHLVIRTFCTMYIHILIHKTFTIYIKL